MELVAKPPVLKATQMWSTLQGGQMLLREMHQAAHF